MSLLRSPKASAATSTSAPELFRQRRLYERNRFLARPFGGAGEITDLAARAVDENRGRQADGAANALQFLKGARARIVVISEILDPDIGPELVRLRRIAGVDVDGDDRKVLAVHPPDQPVERRHLLAAGHAPGRPQVQENGAAAEVGEMRGLSVAVPEGKIGHAAGSFR